MPSYDLPSPQLIKELSPGYNLDTVLRRLGIVLVTYENVPGEEIFLLQSLQPFQIPCRMASSGLRLYGDLLHEYEIDLEPFARICERHTGSGITAEEVRKEQLPIPERDFLPETPEEILICLADKFYSKSGDMQEKSLPRIRRSLEKFGPGPLARFDAMCRLFDLKPELNP